MKPIIIKPLSTDVFSISQQAPTKRSDENDVIDELKVEQEAWNCPCSTIAIEVLNNKYWDLKLSFLALKTMF